MNVRTWVLWMMSAGIFLLWGCEKPAGRAKAPPPPPLTNAAGLLMATNAQPKLPTLKLWIGSQEVTAELAMSIPQIMTGMMFRKQMAESEGMLFVFGRAQRVSFYMKNTLIPLSCAYIDFDGT